MNLYFACVSNYSNSYSINYELNHTITNSHCWFDNVLKEITKFLFISTVDIDESAQSDLLNIRKYS